MCELKHIDQSASLPVHVVVGIDFRHVASFRHQMAWNATGSKNRGQSSHFLTPRNNLSGGMAKYMSDFRFINVTLLCCFGKDAARLVVLLTYSYVTLLYIWLFHLYFLFHFYRMFSPVNKRLSFYEFGLGSHLGYGRRWSIWD